MNHLAEPGYTRFACMHPIHGYHGHFAGCADSGDHNTALLKTSIHDKGGMKHEIDLHEHVANRGTYIKAHGIAAYKAEHARLASAAQKGAKTLTASDKKAFTAHRAALLKHAAELEKQGKGDSPAYQKAIAEAGMLRDHLNRKSGKSASTTGVSNKDREAPKQLIPISQSGALGHVNPNDKPSAYVQQVMYGNAQLHDAVRGYSMAALKSMVTEVQGQNPGTKPASLSKKSALVDYIVQHVSASKPKTSAELDAMRAQRAATPTLQRLRSRIAALCTAI